MPYYPTVTVLLDDDRDDTAELDISARVRSTIRITHGMTNSKPSNRTPASGSAVFEIGNEDEFFAVASLLGKYVSITLTYGGVEKQIFWGYVSNADLTSGFVKPLSVRVTVSDWLHAANNTRVRELEVTTNKRADEAIPIALGIFPSYRPLVPSLGDAHPTTDLDTGYEIFPNMFDGSKNKAKIFSELDKITKSELGYLYMKFRSLAQGDILRFENRYARGSTRALSRVPINYGTPGKLQYHGAGATSGFLKYHGAGATSGILLIHETQDASFDDHQGAGWNVGKLVVNDFSVTDIPRTTVASTVVYTLGSPIEFGANERKRLVFTYSNPDGGSIIQASGVSVSAYELNSQSDGSGTDLTANFAFLGFSFANYLRLHAENLGPAAYLIALELTGTAIYKFNPIEQTAESTESKEDFVRTEISDSITREYSNSLSESIQFANSVVALRRHPTKDINWVSFKANDEEVRLLAFMYLEHGDKINISEIFPEHDGDYYIQGVKADITTSGIIDFTWYLDEEVKTLCTPIAVNSGTDNAGSMVAVDFGILPYLSNLPQFSYSMWVKRLSSDTFAVLISHGTDTGSGRRGNYFLLNTNGELSFVSYKTPTDGIWQVSPALTSTNTWVHVCLTYDNTTDAANPIIYIDGASVTVAETQSPAGSTDDDSDCPLILFNITPDPNTSDRYYYDVLHDVALKDVRVYGKILTPSEVAELAAGEDDYTTVQDTLLFNGIYAPTDNIDDYIADTIENDDMVLDIVHGRAGVPYNEDTTDSTTMLTGESI
jgi:hypothetical protein